MDKQSRQKANKETAAERQKALDNISPEELEKIKSYQASTEGAHKVDREWLLLAEFASEYGWQAYLDVKHDVRDNVTLQEMLTLIEAKRIINSMRLYDSAHAAFIGAASSRAKKPGSAFKRATKDIIKKTKVHD